jgi:hypothetical protein
MCALVFGIVQVNLSIDRKVIEKAKELELNLSKVSENALKKTIQAIESSLLGKPSFKEGSWCGRRDLNPGSRLGKPGSYLARLRPP